MAAQGYRPPAPSYAQLNSPVVVVGPQFCLQYPVDFTVVEKALHITDGNFTVTDVNGTVAFKVKGKMLSLRDRRVLLDNAGNPVLSMQQKVFTAHRRWVVYRGDSTDSKDLLFSTKKSSLIQFKTELSVYLAANTSEKACDFKVKGSYGERACTIYLGESDTIVAQMRRQHTLKNAMLGKDMFGVTIYPNIDYAFIVALIVILDEVNDDRGD
ncbi:protein LURP-one-related 15-like [Phoenix dactylifera]|uniref:Protein LURP-one-related 15-like n=1 Tax=Phoenix dactylifera TaxID=42345 RepID=A0A8B7CIT3_PHODC|nr:protein LURP-one-related 15-like [Phoenix dactylifera]XP_038979960.1 protein LURP-one-related 15-like [Phoenix dactylifera]